MIFKSMCFTILGAFVALNLAACSYTRPMERTSEQAQEFDKKVSAFHEKESIALNIWRQMELPETYKPSDKWLSDEDYKKFYAQQLAPASSSGKILSDTSMLGAITLAQQAFLPTSFSSSMHSMGMGAFFLIGGLFGPDSYEAIDPHWLIYVPVSKAETPQDAWKYVREAFDKAFKNWEKSVGLKLTGERILDGYKNQYRQNYVAHFLTDKAGKCPLITEEQIKEKQLINFIPGGSCVLSFDAKSAPVNEIKTKIPSWLPNGGQEAWKISIARSLFKDFDRKPREGFFKDDLSYDQTRAPFLQKDIVLSMIKDLPDNFYAYVPYTYTKDEERKFPPFVASNKGLYWFIYPKNLE